MISTTTISIIFCVTVILSIITGIIVIANDCTKENHYVYGIEYNDDSSLIIHNTRNIKIICK